MGVRGKWAGWLAASGLVACGASPLPDGVARVEITTTADPLAHWVSSGYTRLTPPVHLPLSSADDDQVEIWAKLPHAGVGAVSGPDGPVLSFGPGTMLDRIELVGRGPNRRVADVRGTTIETDGSQRFHVLRPIEHDRLVGYAWPAGDREAHAAATEAMVDTLAHALAQHGLGQRASERELEAFRAKNDCAGCHEPLQPSATSTEQRIVARGTDASGFYVPTTVLGDSVPVEAYGRHDRNVGAPYRTPWCPSGAVPRLVGDPRRVQCPAGEVPWATLHLDVALATDDRSAHDLCRSRAFLHAAMDDTARATFADAFARCEIATSEGIALRRGPSVSASFPTLTW